MDCWRRPPFCGLRGDHAIHQRRRANSWSDGCDRVVRQTGPEAMRAPVVTVKPIIHRVVCVDPAQVPFADRHRPVPRIPQRGCYGDLVLRQSPRHAWQEHAVAAGPSRVCHICTRALLRIVGTVHPDPGREPAGQQAGTGWRADRGCAVPLGKAEAVPG